MAFVKNDTLVANTESSWPSTRGMSSSRSSSATWRPPR